MRRPASLAGSAILASFAAATACSDGTGPDGPTGASVIQDHVEYTADTSILESFPVQLHTTVHMRNRSPSRREIRLGSGCPVLLRVYRDEARTRLAWDQGQGVACTKEIQIVSLPPGGSEPRSTRVSARDILGDSLPDGRYFLSAHVQVVGAPLSLAAGRAELAVPR